MNQWYNPSRVHRLWFIEVMFGERLLPLSYGCLPPFPLVSPSSFLLSFKSARKTFAKPFSSSTFLFNPFNHSNFISKKTYIELYIFWMNHFWGFPQILVLLSYINTSVRKDMLTIMHANTENDIDSYIGKPNAILMFLFQTWKAPKCHTNLENKIKP